MFIGVAVTSAADGVMASATFDNVWIYGTTALPAAPAVDIYVPFEAEEPGGHRARRGPDKLTWSSGGDKGGTGVGGYRVFRNGVMIGVTRSTSYVDTGLAASTSYAYTVSAYDKASPTNSGLQISPAVTATTLAAPPAP